MTTTLRRTTAAFLVAMCTCIGALLATNNVSAQCTDVRVTNNLDCDVQLCLYSNTDVVARRCWNIPRGTSVIQFPNFFAPDGVVSANGNRYALQANGCSVCYELQHMTSARRCCGVVCWDAHTCSITIGQCTQAICYP